MPAFAEKRQRRLLRTKAQYYCNARDTGELSRQQKYHFDKVDKEDEIGVVRGLAWTGVGGDTLSVEVNIMPGTGRIELTGQLGDVMKESARTAISYIRSKADTLGIEPEFYKKRIFIFTCQRALYRKTVPQPVSRWHAR